MRARSQEIDDVRTEVAAHVGFCERRGTPISFQKALLGHRSQVRENMRDDPGEPFWRERLSLLDAICVEEGVA